MKPFYRSKTLWGVAIVLVTTLARLFGVDTGPYEQQALDLATLIGGIISMIGRQWATEEIKWK